MIKGNSFKIKGMNKRVFNTEKVMFSRIFPDNVLLIGLINHRSKKVYIINY